jgi:tRNA (guanine-N7-)-methyltransferase
VSSRNDDAARQALHPRTIRSFVRREGRLTPGQQRALDRLWPVYGLDATAPLQTQAVFGRSAPITLEIGFGNGASLAEMATREPQQDFIGVEVHRPGVGRLLQELDARGLHNVRIYCHDAVEVVRDAIADASLDRVLILFPDPWPKHKHHKRRLVQPAFAALLARKLKSGGLLHLATDWAPYAAHMREVMQACDAFTLHDQSNDATGLGARRPTTRFEQRGRRLGHPVWDLLYRRA